MSEQEPAATEPDRAADKDGRDDLERAAAHADEDRGKEQDDAVGEFAPGLADGDPTDEG